ncbi:MAG: hypothetical protein IKY84_01860 [Bacteroidaceae bacterium]|nr:hypothetical protein [Bacteroidaceae bacterium]
MKIAKIKKENISYTIFQETDEIGLNPLDYLRCTSFLYIYDMSKRYLQHSFPDDDLLCDAQAKEFARVESLHYVDGLCAQTTLPHVYKDLLSKDLSKKEQVRLLKGTSLTPEQYGLLFLDAGRMGYKLNLYHEELIANQGKEGYPILIEEHTDGDVEYCGETDWTENEMKTLIHQSNRLIARVFVKGDSWHCFYATKKGLAKEEHYSTPHMHYISDKFGLSLEDFVAKFKSGKCPSSEVHIPLLGYHENAANDHSA